jgi:ABC-2 type transport system permease protein
VFAIISAVLLTSIVFSLGGFINALFAKNFDQISWFPTFVLTPLTYLGGVFYSITMLPNWAHIVSHANPILYMVSAFRYGFLGTTDVDLRLAYGIMVGGRRNVHAGRRAVESRHGHPRLRGRWVLACCR